MMFAQHRQPSPRVGSGLADLLTSMLSVNASVHGLVRLGKIARVLP